MTQVDSIRKMYYVEWYNKSAVLKRKQKLLERLMSFSGQ